MTRNLILTSTMIVALIGVTLCSLYSGHTSAATGLEVEMRSGSAEGITESVYLPMVAFNSMDLSVNPQDRRASLDFYEQVYLASEGVSVNWNGDHSTCTEGTTSLEFQQAVRLRINYFRAMAGVPGNIRLIDAFNQKAQKAALMMSVNYRLSHSPDPTWVCYSTEGAQAAGMSNLCVGSHGWDAINSYMHDGGCANYHVGHRRYVLYPETLAMGTGDVPSANGHPAANALLLTESGLRPDTREEFVAWPPPGYVPYQVVYPRWSFSHHKADFFYASVSMTHGSRPISVVQLPEKPGYGDPTLVWEPQLDLSRSPSVDTTYTVTLQDVLIDGVSRDFVYAVTVFDPGTQRAASAEFFSEGYLGTLVKLP